MLDVTSLHTSFPPLDATDEPFGFPEPASVTQIHAGRRVRVRDVAALVMGDPQADGRAAGPELRRFPPS